MTNSRPSPSAGSCRAFLRELEMHVQAHRNGRRVVHVGQCATCRGRLERAVAVASLLRERPPLPARLREPRFLEEIYCAVTEQLVEPEPQMPAGATPGGGQPPLGETLSELYRPMRVPEQAPWPIQDLPELVAEAAGAPGSSRIAPRWLWQRTRAEVLQAVAERRMRLAAFAGAAVLLILSAGWYLAQLNGTSSAPGIVFVRVSEMPSVMHPHAVLRLGGVR